MHPRDKDKIAQLEAELSSARQEIEILNQRNSNLVGVIENLNQGLRDIIATVDIHLEGEKK